MAFDMRKPGDIEYLPPGVEPRQVIQGGFSEADRATDYRERVGKLLTEVIAVMAEAKRDGMTVTFQIGTVDGFGRYSIAALEVSKKLA